MKINVYCRLINIYLSVHIFASRIKVYFKYELSQCFILPMIHLDIDLANTYMLFVIYMQDTILSHIKIL